jgi:acyl dehydratase
MPDAPRSRGAATAVYSRKIDAQGVKDYARALGLQNPIYFDLETARARGYRDIAVPLGFVIAFTVVPREAKFQAAQIQERKALAGGMSFDVRAPICAGDTLSGKCELVAIEEKKGPKPFTLLTCETKLENQAGETVLVVSDTTLEFHQ